MIIGRASIKAGTPNGLSFGNTPFAVVGRYAYFYGTAAGTRLMLDAAPGARSSNPIVIGVTDKAIFLSLDDGAHGAELWRLER